MNPLLITIGVAVALAGILSEKFHPGALGISSDREVPKWIGRLLFIGIGLWCIYLGLKSK